MNSPNIVNVIVVTREVDTIVRLFYISVLTVFLIVVVSKLIGLARGYK